MTKKELEEQLKKALELKESYEAQVATLKRALEEKAYEIPEAPEFDDVEMERSYYINCYLQISPCTDSPSRDFNRFHTREEAEHFRTSALWTAMLIHCKHHLCPDYHPDWSNEDEQKWFVYLHHDGRCQVEYAVYDESPIDTYFDTEENARKAAHWMNSYWRHTV